MTRIRSAALLLGLIALAACEKGGPQDILGTLPGARVRFFNFGVNAPNVNFYAGDTKLTAISATGCTPPTNPTCLTTGLESTVGVAFGAAASNGQYSAVEPGQYVLSGRISAATDKDLPIGRVTQTLEDGKAYSFYLSGIYDATAKSVDAFVVEDPIPEAVDFTITTIRFVNAISNSQPMQLVLRNVASGAEAPVGAAVAYKGATQFVNFGTQSVFNPGGVVDLLVRAPGGTTTLITRTAATFAVGRVYTVTARGDMTVTSTTAANRPFLDITANR